ncbi:hypothetical protein ACLI4Y_17350 [Natrialbaceae archaeon A-CW3]
MSADTERHVRGDDTPQSRRLETIPRRRYLTVLATGAIASLAGCTGGSDDADGGDGSFLPDGDDEDPGDSNGQGAGDNGADEVGSGGDFSGDGFTPGVDESELEELSEEVYFGDVIDYESSFVADLTLVATEMPGPAEGYQRVHGDDFHVYIEETEEIEMYGVDGDLYTIVMGHCSLESRDPEQGQYVPVDQSPGDEYVSLAAVGTTTVNGEEVYVFEHHATVEYLSTTTGYPVRSEWATGRADFHSWGDVDPISPPDMPCTDA